MVDGGAKGGEGEEGGGRWLREMGTLMCFRWLEHVKRKFFW